MSKIFHKFGGQVVAIGVGHRTDNGIPSWHVKGDVRWDDGTESKGLEISPGHLCIGNDPADELPGHREINAVLDAMNKYLGDAGAWLREGKRMRGGAIVHWLPHEKAGERKL